MQLVFVHLNADIARFHPSVFVGFVFYYDACRQCVGKYIDTVVLRSEKKQVFRLLT